MDRIYRIVNIKDQETQHYYSHLTQHDARQRCPALIVLKEEYNNNNNNNVSSRSLKTGFTKGKHDHMMARSVLSAEVVEALRSLVSLDL